MIIKSLSRKDKGCFAQLLHYVHGSTHPEHSLSWLHNFPAETSFDLVHQAKVFEKNFSLRSHKQGIRAFHEILSFHPKDRAYLEEHPEILEDLVNQYLNLRCPYALASVTTHTSEDHLHVHCIISSNNKEERASLRLSKKEFQAIRREMETYQLEQYPQLRSYVQARDSPAPAHTVPNNLFHHAQRGGDSYKEELAQTVRKIVLTSQNIQEIIDQLHTLHIKTYQRKGVLGGIIIGNRKHRLTTLLRNHNTEKTDLEKIMAQHKRTSPSKELGLER